ncbi:MAG TPA: acyl-CoA dehydrogenase family protein [Candidatus Angelobacter sp.]|jgi:alkylation response protein AidB-like acyl-CoA dehydrogenase|nr:acyl-CoA dehydrogenase family protein [Candidatus Angelobacter sp.]
MDFQLSPEDAAFQEEVRDWLASHREQIDHTRAVDWEDGGESFERYRAWERILFEAGLGAVAWPKEYGGRAATLMQQALFTDEYVKAKAPDRINRLGLGLLGPTLMVFGSDEQKAEHLPRILRCDEIWCQGFSEPNAGSDLASLRTRAEVDGDDFVVNGQKIWTSLGRFGDWIFTLCRTDPAAPKHKGISFILIDMRSPGVEVRPLVQIDGSARFAEVFFSDVRVPRTNLVGPLNDGWKVAMTTLGFERGTGLGSPAAFNRMFADVVDLTRREQRTEDPDVRRRVAQQYIETRLFELNNRRTLSKLVKGAAVGSEASLNKLYWSEMETRLEELALDVLGPRAELTEGSPDAEHDGRFLGDYLYARASMIYAGTNEIQKNIIAQRVLGLPREA